MQQPFTLNALGGGQSAVITAVHGTGEMHARLRDLGFTEESRVTCLFSSAFGDPRAYRVKDTVIALRGDDARCVCCERDEDGALVCRRAECGRCDGRELIIDGKEEYGGGAEGSPQAEDREDVEAGQEAPRSAEGANGSGRRSPKRPAGGIWADKEAEGLWDAGSDALWSADRRSVETKEAKEPGTAAGGEP